MRYKILFTWVALIGFHTAFSQISSPHNGAPPSKNNVIGIKNATLLLADGKKMDNASLLIEGDKIKKVDIKIDFPEGATVLDYTGKTVLASFIELSTNSGIEAKHDHNKKRSPFPQFLSNKIGPYYWNESIAAENNWIDFYNFEKQQESLAQMGFGFLVPNPGNGIARGTSPLIALVPDPRENGVVSSKIASFFSLEKADSDQTYPSSQMGSIALLRQALIDAFWYGKTKNIPVNYTLEALFDQVQKTIIFEAQDRLETLRIAKVLKEFNLNAIVRCGGDEYQSIHLLKDLSHHYILPLKFPEAVDVSNPFIAREIPLNLLKHWEMAPSNPMAFHQNKLTFAFSSVGVKSAKDFWGAIHKTIEAGLPWEKAYAALSSVPASLLKVDNELGALKANTLASFSVYSHNPFLYREAELLESWQLGARKIHKIQNLVDLRGNYNLNLSGSIYTLYINGSQSRPEAKLARGSNMEEKNSKELIPCNISFDGKNVSLDFKLIDEERQFLQGQFYPKLGTIEGQGLKSDGTRITWSAIRHKFNEEKPTLSQVSLKDSSKLNNLWFPNLAYGGDTLRSHNNYLIRNATIWTGEKEGVIQNGDILVTNGKIKYVGTGTFQVPKNTKVIDAEGKVVTAGIIDEHSHIAISKGVNESGLSITSEVSIGTVINPDDINIFRQLAGGVTCSQLLHGSANAIGGQSAIIKLKWGYDAEGLLLPNAPKFIKFALGENVKQTNWGDYNVTRFPQTRMGVEQVFYDAFYQAKHYSEAWEESKKKKTEFRRDLKLEALAEILKGERHITCHSYVQSEINMLMKVGDSLGFKINTFTHILEGYKLIPQMVKHGAGGSTFSDWWAYKYEVIDAIPHNTCLMSRGGVVTAINSDDAEMGRRLNQEAAKAVKYGGLSEQEAWLTVTLNPAKLLHIDDRTGSIKEGKDADLVIWSENPLSVNAKCEQTFIDGILFFDIRELAAQQKRNEQERLRIINLMLEAAKQGEPTTPFLINRQPLYHCDTEEHHTHHHGH